MAFDGPKRPATTGVSGHDTGARVWLWEAVTDGDDSNISPVKIPYKDDLTIYAFGTFGAAASISLQGSPEIIDPPTLFANLTAANTTIALAAAGCALVDQNAIWYKPVLTGGDVSTDIDVYIVAK